MTNHAVPHLPVLAPLVVEGELVAVRPPETRHTRPDGHGMRLVGGPVVDAREIGRIRARAEYAALPWRRLFTPAPEGW